MPRHVLALDLKDDPELIAQYRAWHRPGTPPQAIARSIRSAGIDRLEIYLAGNRLVMIIEADDDFSLAEKAKRDAGNPDVQAWETLMWRFQQPLPGTEPGEKWVSMEAIYSLAEHP